LKLVLKRRSDFSPGGAKEGVRNGFYHSHICLLHLTHSNLEVSRLDGKDIGIVRAIDLLCSGLLAVSGIMIVVMAFSATYGVARRYFLHNPEPYSYEISMMLLVWCFVLSVAALQKHERHLRGDFILSRFPPRLQFFINHILSPGLAVLCSVVLVWKGWEAAMFSLRIGELSMSSWAESIFPVKILIPVGYSILCLVALMQLFKGIFVFRKGIPKIGT
jgi:TRAP-type mannitol/chloroaromatic compound transport system permease small subunit